MMTLIFRFPWRVERRSRTAMSLPLIITGKALAISYGSQSVETDPLQVGFESVFADDTHSSVKIHRLDMERRDK